MSNIITVSHAGKGERLGGFPRVQIWCDVVPGRDLMALFEDVANGEGGIIDVHRSSAKTARVELIIDPSVNVNKTAGNWIAGVNKRLSEIEETTPQLYQQLVADHQPGSHIMAAMAYDVKSLPRSSNDD